LFTIGYDLDPPKFGAHSPKFGRPVDGRWRRQHPAASVGTNIFSSLLSAVAVLCFRNYYVCCRQWVTAGVSRLPSTSITLQQRT